MTEKHVEHDEICSQIHELYLKKNADYGDSFAKLRKEFPDFVCMRVYDKLNRLRTLIDPNYTQQVEDEKIEDTLLDIANYCIMEVLERRLEAERFGSIPCYCQSDCATNCDGLLGFDENGDIKTGPVVRNIPEGMD